MPKTNNSTKGTYTDGQWNVAHLKFLVDFMKAAGISTVQVAEAMGLTRQAVYHWFVRDDMKMSQIFRLFEAFGYSISFDFDDVRSSAPVESPALVTMSVVNTAPDRLSFFRSALDRHGITLDALSSGIQVGRSTISRWFTTDDCFVSYLYRFATFAGIRLTIDIRPCR